MKLHSKLLGSFGVSQPSPLSFQPFTIEFLVRQCQELLDEGFQITIRCDQHSRTHIAQPVINSAFGDTHGNASKQLRSLAASTKCEIPVKLYSLASLYLIGLHLVPLYCLYFLNDPERT